MRKKSKLSINYKLFMVLSTIFISISKINESGDERNEREGEQEEIRYALHCVVVVKCSLKVDSVHSIMLCSFRSSYSTDYIFFSREKIWSIL